MGSTRSSRSNATNQIDSRQIHETVNNVEHRFDDSFNNTNEFDVRDDSRGNISAGGNVTVESVDASIAASRAAERLAEEQRRVAETQAEEQRKVAEAQAEEQRRATEAQTRLLADIAEQNRRIQEEFSRTQREQAQQATDQSRIFVQSNTAVSTKAIEEAVKATEEAVRAVEKVSSDALFTNKSVVSDALDTNEDNLRNTLNFLETDNAQDGRVFEDNFQFLGETIREANELSNEALSSAFKSTVGGLADEQQQTLLIGLGIIAALIALMAWRKL